MKVDLTWMTPHECHLFVEQIWHTAKRVKRIRSDTELSEDLGISKSSHSRRVTAGTLYSLSFATVVKLIRLAGYDLVVTRREP